ncbi:MULTISPECIES: hypothetical protein [Bacillaceae]|uniref:hypothetical protein n=1 Tax=Bacillaceae TaxID=186817 RepID=UPI00115E5DB1|nr:hypothetical protein [Bacillus sp. PK3_68]
MVVITRWVWLLSERQGWLTYSEITVRQELIQLFFLQPGELPSLSALVHIVLRRIESTLLGIVTTMIE